MGIPGAPRRIRRVVDPRQAGGDHRGRDLLSLAAGFAMAISIGVRGLREDLLETTNTVASAAGQYSAVGLAFDDREEAYNSLAALRVFDTIEYACLYGLDERPSSNTSGARPAPPARDKDGQREEAAAAADPGPPVAAPPFEPGAITEIARQPRAFLERGDLRGQALRHHLRAGEHRAAGRQGARLPLQHARPGRPDARLLAGLRPAAPALHLAAAGRAGGGGGPHLAGQRLFGAGQEEGQRRDRQPLRRLQHHARADRQAPAGARALEPRPRPIRLRGLARSQGAAARHLDPGRLARGGSRRAPRPTSASSCG